MAKAWRSWLPQRYVQYSIAAAAAAPQVTRPSKQLHALLQVLELIIPYVIDLQSLLRCSMVDSQHKAITTAHIQQQLPALLLQVAQENLQDKLTSLTDYMRDNAQDQQVSITIMDKLDWLYSCAGPKAAGTPAAMDAFLQMVSKLDKERARVATERLCKCV